MLEVHSLLNTFGIHQLVLILTFFLLQLIDCGKVNVKDVASDIGLSSDSLAASLAVMQTR